MFDLDSCTGEDRGVKIWNLSDDFSSLPVGLGAFWVEFRGGSPKRLMDGKASMMTLPSNGIRKSSKRLVSAIRHGKRQPGAEACSAA